MSVDCVHQSIQMLQIFIRIKSREKKHLNFFLVAGSIDGGTARNSSPDSTILVRNAQPCVLLWRFSCRASGNYCCHFVEARHENSTHSIALTRCHTSEHFSYFLPCSLISRTSGHFDICNVLFLFYHTF